MGEHHSGRGVDVADGVVLIGVVRIALRGVQTLVGAGPKDEKPVPPSVERQVAHRPADAVADLVVIHRVGEHPLGGPLEDGEPLDPVGDRGCDLEAAGAGPDERDPLSRQVDGVIPGRGMEGRSLEGVGAVEIRKVRPV